MSTILNKRYFTRDCPACPFWSDGCCTMVANCSTFQDLFSGGTFYSALTITKTVSVTKPIPDRYKDGYYVDCDGLPVDKMTGDGFDVARKLAENREIVGVMVPESDN